MRHIPLHLRIWVSLGPGECLAMETLGTVFVLEIMATALGNMGVGLPAAIGLPLTFTVAGAWWACWAWLGRK